MSKFFLSKLVLCAVVIAAMCALFAARRSDAADECPSTPTVQCANLSVVLDQMKKEAEERSQEMRQVKRELALLRQRMEKPGVRDAIAGIGYIAGICGLMCYLAARKRVGAVGTETRRNEEKG